MASSRVMPSSNSRNSDLSRAISPPSSSKSKTQQRDQQHLYHTPKYFSDRPNRRGNTENSGVALPMTLDGMLRDAYSSSPPTESTLLDASITLMDAPSSVPAPPAPLDSDSRNQNGKGTSIKTADEVWREIAAGERKEMKEETQEETMTLEDFLMKTEVDVKVAPDGLSGSLYAFDSVPSGAAFHMMDKMEGPIVGFGNGVEGYGGSGGRGKRGRMMMDPLDKAAAQRQRRMIKNRESAARSRERKQAYQVELESLALRLEQENEQLLKEKEERAKERLKQLMERIIPVVEKRRPQQRGVLRRVRSFEL